MKPLIEERIETPVIGDFDVCVIGGSATGVFAAVRAAQAGARVALVEANGFFGGVATAGLVNIWHSLYDTEGKKQIISGLTEEIIERLKKRNAVSIKNPDNPHVYAIFNAAELTIELDELVCEQKSIRPFLHTRFVRPILDGEGHVSHAVIEDKSGRRAIKASFFVDASGDGDLIHRAGLPTRKNATPQPPTTGAGICGIEEVAKLNPGFRIEDVLNPKKFNAGFKHSFMWSSEFIGVPGMHFVAASRMNGTDSSDADSLTAAEIEGRRQIRKICDIVRENFKTNGKFGLGVLPASTGIRESRHCDCLHKLSELEVLEGNSFDDSIANGSYVVDIHHGGGITFKRQDGRMSEMLVSPGEEPRWVEGRWREERELNPTFYQIPYRCLVPKGSENVLCAGRLIDCDPGAYGAIRVMVNCNQTGEAAGLAATLALSGKSNISKVDPKALRKSLSKAGCIII
ncbi:MAG: hypothetical protein A2X49_08405 [Lentisphaerae bacterium GWF2_52_8]|nr:MAG: hypothetical protein A2X49_08405 [Lentisphaerae bacterium GWF2_52_8]